MILLVFIGGVVLGCLLGVFLLALLMAGRSEDDE